MATAKKAGKPVLKTMGNLPGAGPGRPKGLPNKFTKDLKEMILGALDSAGGVDYLTERANDPKTASAFLTLIGKVLPMQVTGADGGEVKHVFRVELVPMDDNSTD